MVQFCDKLPNLPRNAGTKRVSLEKVLKFARLFSFQKCRARTDHDLFLSQELVDFFL